MAACLDSKQKHQPLSLGPPRTSMCTALSGCLVGNPRNARILPTDTLLASLQTMATSRKPQTAFTSDMCKRGISERPEPAGVTLTSLFLLPDTHGTGHRFRDKPGPPSTASPRLSESRRFSGGGSGRAWRAVFSARSNGSTSPVGTCPPSLFPKHPGRPRLTHNSRAFLLLTCRISMASGFTSPLWLSVGPTAAGPPCRNQTHLPESE